MAVSEPDVSVILPIYNAEPYLEEALDSVVNQTHPNIEIICVNDGSTDSSLEIIRRYAERDQRIIIDDGPNGGYGSAMNRGLCRAVGGFIAILEPDDVFRLDMIEKLLPIARRDDLDFIRANFYRFTTKDDGSHVYKEIAICHNGKNLYNRVLNPQDDLELFNVRMQNWTGLTKRSFIEEHHIRFHESPGARFQDNSFWFQTYCWATRVEYVDEPFYCHRDDNPNSSTNRSDLTFAMLDEWKWMQEYLSRYPEKETKLARVFQHRKYYNCYFAFTKLADELQEPYVMRWSAESCDSYEKGELLVGRFPKNDATKIKKLIEDPKGFLDEYRTEKAAGKDLESARAQGAVALFKYYCRHEGVARAIGRSFKSIIRSAMRAN